jgi:hypothetical protein
MGQALESLFILRGGHSIILLNYFIKIIFIHFPPVIGNCWNKGDALYFVREIIFRLLTDIDIFREYA